MLAFNSFLPINITYLFFYTAILIAGIWWQSTSLNMGYAFVLCLILIFCYALNQGFNTRTFAHSIILIGIFGLGTYRYASYMKQFHDFYHTFDNSVYDLHGTIIELETVDRPRFKELITIQVTSLSNKETSHEADNIVIQIYSSTHTKMQWNDTVIIKNIRIKKPTSTNYENYLRKEGIACSIFASKLIYVILEHQPSLFSRIKNLRQNIMLSCKRKMSETSFAFFSAIFTGNKTMLNKNVFNEYKEQFKWWGISHHLARSGLHLVLFSLLLNLLLALFPLHFFIKQLLLFLIIVTYSLLSWPSISFIRAFFIILLYLLCSVMELPINTLHLLCILTCAVLIYNPMQLFFLDFQLSFALTFALAWIHHACRAHIISNKIKS